MIIFYLFSVINQLDAQVLSQPVHRTATYRCDDTKGCIVQFWPPDDEHMAPIERDDTRGCIVQFWPPDDELEMWRGMK